jgi:signal transduction histidine kinase
MRAIGLAAAIVSGIAAFALAVLPQLQFVHNGVLLHVALETAATLIALLAGFLFFGRLRRRGNVNDLLLACALSVFVLLNLSFLILPALARSRPNDLIVWVLLIGRSLGAVLFALAAFASHRRLWRPGLALAASVAGGCAIVLLLAVTLNGVAEGLVHPLAGTSAPDPLEGPTAGGHPALVTLQLVTATLYGVAAAGFLRWSRRLGDGFLLWLAIAAALAAFSHLNYSLYPFSYAQLVHTGDIFRLCFYATLLVGSMREIWSYWHALSEAAVLEERRRIACDLHDGLAQELAYLARNLDSADGEAGKETLDLLRGAVERAQHESRRIVRALTAPCAEPVEPVEVLLAQATAEVAKRFHLGLQLDLVPGVKVSAAREDALVRIACEAVANAARHSGANWVHLKLERDGPRLRLRVSDKGRGFDPAVTHGGFGLASMRQRARSVGGELWISSVPGQGSEVEAFI